MPKLNLKEPKGQIMFLDAVLDEKIKQLLLQEARRRTLESLLFAEKGKEQMGKLQMALTESKGMINTFREEIRHIKALMLDLGNGNFTV